MKIVAMTVSPYAATISDPIGYAKYNSAVKLTSGRGSIGMVIQVFLNDPNRIGGTSDARSELEPGRAVITASRKAFITRAQDTRL